MFNEEEIQMLRVVRADRRTRWTNRLRDPDRPESELDFQGREAQRVKNKIIIQLEMVRRHFEYAGLINLLDRKLTTDDLQQLSLTYVEDEMEVPFRETDRRGGAKRTPLESALVIAALVPEVIGESSSREWLDLGSGTGMAELSFASWGHRVLGIEMDGGYTKIAVENRELLEKMLQKRLPAQFIQATLPDENHKTTIDKNLLERMKQAGVWYSYPWPNEAVDRAVLFRRYAARDAVLVLFTDSEFSSYDPEEIEKIGLKRVELRDGEFQENVGHGWIMLFKKDQRHRK